MKDVNLKVAIQTASTMVKVIKTRGLHVMLECDVEENPYKFNGSAQLYVNHVLIMIHPSKDGKLRFSPVPPPDDSKKIPKGALKGFSVPMDFDPKVVAKQVRKLCSDVRKQFEQYGVTAHIYDVDEFSLDEAITIDDNGRIVGMKTEVHQDDDEFDRDEGEEWKKGTPYVRKSDDSEGEEWKTGERSC